jgi:hypothetical protein
VAATYLKIPTTLKDMHQDFEIEIRDIKYGWALFQIEIGHKTFSLRASAVFHDSIAILAEAGARIASGADFESVPINEEPTEYSLDLLRRGELVEVALIRTWACDLTDDRTPVLASACCSLDHVIAATRQALERVALNMSLEAYGEAWSYPFPEDWVAILQERS